MKQLIVKFNNFLNHYREDKSYKIEIWRKLFHIVAIAWIPILYMFLAKKTMLMVIYPIAILVIIADFYRHRIDIIGKIFHGIFGHILREEEFQEDKWTGATFVALSAIITFTIFPKNIAIPAFFILAISDCLASLIGGGFKSKEFFEKSIAGSIAFGVSAFLVLVIWGIFSNQLWTYYFFGAFAIFATTIIEARPSLFNVDDNFTIPISFATIMMFFAIIWELNY